MKYYTSSIPSTLADKLKATGMPIEKESNNFLCPTYAEVFDWLMDKGWLVNIGREYDFANEEVTDKFEWAIEKVGYFSNQHGSANGWSGTWHEASNTAIENALELIK